VVFHAWKTSPSSGVSTDANQQEGESSGGFLQRLCRLIGIRRHVVPLINLLRYPDSRAISRKISWPRKNDQSRISASALLKTGSDLKRRGHGAPRMHAGECTRNAIATMIVLSRASNHASRGANSARCGKVRGKYRVLLTDYQIIAVIRGKSPAR